MEKKRIVKGLKLIARGLPIVAAAVASFLPIPPVGRQLLILVMLVWLQVFFVMDSFWIER
jgi:hypothetical protein